MITQISSGRPPVKSRAAVYNLRAVHHRALSRYQLVLVRRVLSVPVTQRFLSADRTRGSRNSRSSRPSVSGFASGRRVRTIIRYVPFCVRPRFSSKLSPLSCRVCSNIRSRSFDVIRLFRKPADRHDGRGSCDFIFGSSVGICDDDDDDATNDLVATAAVVFLSKNTITN